MTTRSILVTAFAFAGTAALIGCGPHVRKVEPKPLARLEPVEVKGSSLDHTTIHVDTVPVGAAMVTDHKDSRTIILPAETGPTVNLFAMRGKDRSNTVHSLKVNEGHVAPPPPVFTITAHRDPVTQQAVFIATGQYIYPGAGSANEPFQGPSAVALDMTTNKTIAATESVCIKPGEYRFSFDGLPVGSYRIRVTNHPIYGGQSSDSTNTVRVP